MIKTLIKTLIAIGIFYWLITSGRLDFGLVVEALKHYPLSFVAGAILIMVQVTAISFRFGFLLRTRSPHLSFKKLIGIQWIAQLFSTVLPGGSSDLVKINYVKELDESLPRTYILFMMIFDRIIGLSALLFISGVTSLIYFRELISLNSMMEKLIFVNIALFLLTVVGIAFIFTNENIQIYLLKLIPGQRLKELIREIWLLRKHKKLIFGAYIINIFSHLLGILAFWIVNKPFFEGPISFKFLATLIPIGQLATVIPISPGGIGVGHAAFSTLFNFIHHSNGASLFNIFWIMLMVTNCIGVFPFLFRKTYKGKI